VLAAPLLARIGQALDALPQQATISSWIAACQAFANDTGMLSATDRHTDLHAWQSLVEGWQEIDRVSQWLGHEAVLSRREFAELLQDVVRTQTLPADSDEAGRVRVLSADSARHVSAPYVFLAGLSERSFPPAQREDCLYGEAETRELVAAGLPLAPRVQRRWHEMLLFYQVATRATRRLVLSYPALDDAAQPLSPSPYLSEVERVFAARPIVHAARPSLSAVPSSDVIYSPRELRVRAVANALSGDGSLLGQLSAHPITSPVARSIVAGLAAIGSREARSFGPFEGMLESDEARGLLAGRFGSDHCWSPSQLEQYAKCPFQFFMERVLGVTPCEDPVLAVDYAGRGQMLHRLLATLHRRLNENAGRPTAPGELSAAAFGEQLAQLVAEALPRRLGDRPLADGLLEIDVRRMAAQLTAYYEQHAAYDALHGDFDGPLRPAHFEVPFGPQRGEELERDETANGHADALGSEQPFVLELCGESIRFSGRIDRVDLGTVAGQVVFSIIDYKSGRSQNAKAAAIVEGMALQLPLYALATERMLKDQDAVPVRVGYWHVAGKGCAETIELAEIARGKIRPNAAWKSLLRELPKRVISLARGVRQGQFPMASDDDQCTSRCGYSTVCRVNQVRSLAKQLTWEPPAEDAP
jgi:RecB family exonuclease